MPCNECQEGQEVCNDSCDEPVAETDFEIVRPAKGQFVFVLDKSSSMDDFERWIRLQQSTSRWLKYDVNDGSYVGIVAFSGNLGDASIVNVADMTQITNDTRYELIEKVNDPSLFPNGGTCLGWGVLEGLDVLAQTSPHGGNMIFITDGKFEVSYV